MIQELVFPSCDGSMSCDILHETGGTICYGHWVLRLVISDLRERGGGKISYGHWVLPLVLSLTKQEVRFVTGIGFCVLGHHTRDTGVRLVTGIGFCVL